MILALLLSIILYVGLQYAARLFTNDIDVLKLIGMGIPVIFLLFPSLRLKQLFIFSRSLVVK